MADSTTIEMQRAVGFMTNVMVSEPPALREQPRRPVPVISAPAVKTEITAEDEIWRQLVQAEQELAVAQAKVDALRRELSSNRS